MNDIDERAQHTTRGQGGGDAGAAQAQLRPLKRFALYALIAGVLIAAWGIYSRLQSRTALVQLAQQTAVPVVDVVAPVKSQLAGDLQLPGNVEAFSDAPIYA